MAQPARFRTALADTGGSSWTSDFKTSIISDNYIYISHLDSSWCDPNINANPKFWKLPSYPDTITDTMQSTFTPTTALGRTAPVFTYSSSGPRSVQVTLKIHRDIMDDLNAGISNADLQTAEGYTDSLIRSLQSIALPRYNLTNKFVEPPLVALRLGNEIFIKGIVTGAIGLTYEKPILSDNRYALVTISLSISEVDPYDAETVFKNGGFRGMVNTYKDVTAGVVDSTKAVITESRMGSW